MPLRALRHSVALFALVALGSASLHAQAAVEYGVMTGNAAAATAGGSRALIPFPNITLPGAGSSPSAGPAPASGPAGVPNGTAEAAAKANLQFFESHAGPDAASLAVHTVPDHASVWIDGKFLGTAPVLALKLAPGHHQIIVRSPNMQESTREFDLTAKQSQTLDFALKSSYQNQVTVHWGSQK